MRRRRVRPGEEAARASLLGLLVARAERESSRVYPFRRVGWPMIEACAFVSRVRATPEAQQATSAAPAWMIEAASRHALGVGDVRPSRRGALARLRVLFEVERAFRRIGQGLRFEEIAAATGVDERALWNALQWARRQGSLSDEGECGWFVPGSKEHARAREFLARRAA